MKKYLLTMLAVLVGSNMWAQSFSYDESNKTLTIEVTTDLSNDNDAAGNVQTKMAEKKPETVIVNGGGKSTATLSRHFCMIFIHQPMPMLKLWI